MAAQKHPCDETSEDWFTVYTRIECYFDVRNIDDLIRRRFKSKDTTPTQSVWSQRPGDSVKWTEDTGYPI